MASGGGSGGSGGSDLMGNVIRLNRDDDDTNGVEDREQGPGPLSFDDDDLERMIIKVDEMPAADWVSGAAGGAEGLLEGVSLQISYSGNLALWRTQAKDPFDGEGDGSESFAFTSGGAPSGVPSELYVEGLEPGTGTVTVSLIAPTDTAPAGEVVAADAVNFTVVDMKLFWVSFGDEDTAHDITEDPGGGGQVYSSQHWRDWNLDGDALDPDDHQWPVAYTRGTTMSARACFKLGGPWPGGQIQVRAQGPDGIQIGPTGATASVGGPTATTSMVLASQAFPPHVKHYDDFVLDWQASVDGGATWFDVGTSSNDLYLTLDDPEVDTLYHTVVHLGSHYAQGATTANDVVFDVWGDVFSNHVVERVDGMSLWYFHDYGIPHATTAKLLTPISVGSGVLGDGKCEAWVNLMSDVLKAQGITSHSLVTIVPDGSVISPAPHGFLVNQWSFSGAGSSDAAIVSFDDPGVDRNQLVETYPYLNVLQADKGAWNEQRNGYEFRSEDVTDGAGFPGKGVNANPNAIFANHGVIEYDTGAATIWFDPSYAQFYQGAEEHDREANFEDGGPGDPAMIAGYDVVQLATVKESVVQVDINGDSDFDDEEEAWVMLAKPNNLAVREVVVQGS